MADLIQSGLASLSTWRKAHAAQTVTYRRGAETVDVTATYGPVTWRFDNEFGITVRAEVFDFMISVADLVLNGSAVEPARHDEIDVVAGGATRTYVVGSPNEEPAWRFTDGYRRTFRIHTNLVNET